jgi:ACS family sodium-dependent inorganic phosphate cotransporter
VTDWKVLVLLASLSVVLCYADRANLSTAILPMAEQYGWDDAFKGVVLSAFFAGYAATQVLGGSLADKHGGKRVLAVGVALWSVFTALTPAAAAAGAAPLLIVRALLGVGEGVAFPAIHSLIATNVPRERQSTAVGFATAASYAGTAIAFGLAPVVIASRGWPDVFHLFGASALFWLPFWLPVRERRKAVVVGGGGGGREGGGVNEASPLLMQQQQQQQRNSGGGNSATAAATPKPPSSSSSSTAALRRLWSRREVKAIAACQYAQSYGMYGLLTWLPSFYSERYGVAVADLGGYTLLPYVLQGGLGLASGYLADRLIDAWSQGGGGGEDGLGSDGKPAGAIPPALAAERRAKAVRKVRVSLQLSGMLGPAACLLYAVSPLAEGDAQSASAAVTLGLALSALTLGGVSASHLDVAPKHAGAVFGAGNTAATAAGLVATPLTGLVLRWTGGSWAWVFGLVAAHYVVGSAAWWAWAGDRPLPEDEEEDGVEGGSGGSGGGWEAA